MKKKSKSTRVKLSAQKLFNLTDLDNDGKIDAKQLKTALHSCGLPADKIEVEAYQAFINKEHGGKIDFKVFKQICKELKPDTGADQKQFYKEQMEFLAFDEDGWIEIGKFKNLMTRQGLRLGPSIVNDFLSHCKVKDGMISVDEIADKLGGMKILT